MVDRSSPAYKESAAAYRRQRYRVDPDFRARVHAHTKAWKARNPPLPPTMEDEVARQARREWTKSQGAYRKTAQLGMDYGTATHRLRRAATWALLVALGRTSCFRCHTEMTVESYSLDHIEPWFDNDVSLFWDVANLAYSHQSCNSGAARQVRRNEVVDGQAWCGRCKSWKSALDFTGIHDLGDWDGKRRSCRACGARLKRGGPRISRS